MRAPLNGDGMAARAIVLRPSARAIGALAIGALALAGCNDTFLSGSDQSCGGRIGFSPCQDAGAPADGGSPARVPPDAPTSGPAPALCGANFGFEDGTLQGFQASSCCGIDVGQLENSTDRPWCGQRSLALTLSVLPGLFPDGATIGVQLSPPVDLTGRTLAAHVYVDAPAGARLYGAVTVTGAPASLLASPVQGLPAGRWSALGTVPVVGPLAAATGVEVRVLGADFAGMVTVYVDEVGWQ